MRKGLRIFLARIGLTWGLLTAWIHNRTRMIAASLLSKDLLVDWRQGERYFMQRLVDGAPAENNGGWQWTAGTGTDAAPCFRALNRVLQGCKFDPHGDYVGRWVPELASVPARIIPLQLSIIMRRASACWPYAVKEE